MIALLIGFAVLVAVLHVIALYSEDRIRDQERARWALGQAERERAERDRARRLRLDRQYTREAAGKRRRNVT